MSAIRPLLRNTGVRNFIRRSYHDQDFKPVTMNDLPVPGGSWKTDYDAKNSKYNMHLLCGVVFTTVTLVTAKASGLVYWNYNPPSKPAEED